jgi:hypothetical protein
MNFSTNPMHPFPLIQLGIVLAFELAGQLRAQRLRAPSIRVRPRPALRLLAFAHPILGNPQIDKFLFISKFD